MKKILQLLSVICLIAGLTGCTTGVIRGAVVDVQGNPIENAQVQTQPPTASILTTSDGYIIRKVVTGEYVVMASKNGYRTGSVVIEVKPGKLTHANIVLEQKE